MKRTAAVILLACAQPALAADKSQYNLFNPTPREHMRDMATDRPDQTESPYTVDAGHIQVEADILKLTRNTEKFGGNDTDSRQWDFAAFNFKVGLTNNTEIQFINNPYSRKLDRDRAARTRQQTEGSGDVTIRLKHNLWGNDGGTDSFGIMPYVKIPTNHKNLGNNEVEGGFIALYARDLGGGYGLGLMPQLDIARDSDNTGYHPSYLQTATISKEWTDALATYYEIFLERAADSNAHWKIMFDTGVTYALTPDIQLDAGVNIGLTKAADDYVPFVGISYRY